MINTHPMQSSNRFHTKSLNQLPYLFTHIFTFTCIYSPVLQVVTHCFLENLELAKVNVVVEPAD